MKLFKNASILLFSVAILLCGDLFAQGTSIGIVDIDAIVKEMPEAQAADKEFADKSNAIQDSATAKRTDIETKYQNYQKQKSMMPADKQAQEEKKLQDEAQAVQTYLQEKQNELQQLRERLLAPIRTKVSEIISIVAKEEKLQIILAKDPAAVPYFDTKMDITFKVIDRMKRGK